MLARTIVKKNCQMITVGENITLYVGRGLKGCHKIVIDAPKELRIDSFTYPERSIMSVLQELGGTIEPKS